MMMRDVMNRYYHKTMMRIYEWLSAEMVIWKLKKSSNFFYCKALDHCFKMNKAEGRKGLYL